MKIHKYLEHSPVFAINSAYEAMVPSLNQRLKKEGVNFLQGLVLTALFFEGERRVTPSALAQTFHTSRGNMSHILSHLEYKSWIKRVLNPEDARQFHLELRPEGKRKAIALIKIYDQIQEIFEKELGASFCQKTVTQLRRIVQTHREQN